MKTTLKSKPRNIIGAKVKLARIRNKITQEQLAARLELNDVQIDRIAISRIESGNRFVADYEVVELAKALNISVEFLLSVDWELIITLYFGFILLYL